jgi:pimeloyl-ACP methyl ester carboxylesterase
VHGHEVAYVRAGRGPKLLLLHGLGCDHRTWLPVLSELSRHFTVIAPDLLGHGRSAKPRADYSVAGYANGVRDLLTVLGVDRVTVVGHSLGGGVALQFAYQFPERVERLCLVSSGGIGAEVSMLLRLVSLPVTTPLLAAMTTLPVRRFGSAALSLLARTRLTRFRDAGELGRIYEQLGDPATRLAFRSVVRGVIDWQGQIITLADRAYLAAQMPMCVVWGEHDPVIPSAHAQVAAEHLPAARTGTTPAGSQASCASSSPRPRRRATTPDGGERFSAAGRRPSSRRYRWLWRADPGGSEPRTTDDGALGGLPKLDLPLFLRAVVGFVPTVLPGQDPAPVFREVCDAQEPDSAVQSGRSGDVPRVRRVRSRGRRSLALCAPGGERRVRVPQR